MGPYGPQPGPGPNPAWAPTRPGPQPGLEDIIFRQTVSRVFQHKWMATKLEHSVLGHAASLSSRNKQVNAYVGGLA